MSSTLWRSNITGAMTSRTSRSPVISAIVTRGRISRVWTPKLVKGLQALRRRRRARLTRLFNPRTDTWDQHFHIQAGRIIGLTPVGRTTVYVLNMNRPDRIRIRVELEPETFLG